MCLICCLVLRLIEQNPSWLLPIGPTNIVSSVLSLMLLFDSSCVWKYRPNWYFGMHHGWFDHMHDEVRPHGVGDALQSLEGVGPEVGCIHQSYDHVAW